MGIDDNDIIRDSRLGEPSRNKAGNYKGIVNRLYQYLKKYGPFQHTVKQGNLSNLTYEHIAMVDLLQLHFVTFRKRGMYLATYDGGDGKIGVYCPICAVKIMNMRREVKRLLNFDEKQINALENDGWLDSTKSLPSETQVLLRTKIDWGNGAIRSGCEILNILEGHNVYNSEVIRFDVKAISLKKEITPDCICDYCMGESKIPIQIPEEDWNACANAQVDYIIEGIGPSPFQISFPTQEEWVNAQKDADY